MPVLAVTANVLIGFALYFGVVAALYGGTDVGLEVRAATVDQGIDPGGGGSSGRKSAFGN